jgi:hypothetical protein
MTQERRRSGPSTPILAKESPCHAGRQSPTQTFSRSRMPQAVSHIYELWQ